MDRFGVSIKGVLNVDGKFLLRKNERGEYELLGGRLEKGDSSAEHRVKTEFLEESGIEVDVICHREPWLYEIGLKNIMIVPFICKATKIPDSLFDEDGGTLHWIDAGEIPSLLMPQGYQDTILGTIPHKSYSIPAGFYFKTIPNYIETDYCIDICVNENGNELFRGSLPHFHSPRDFIAKSLGEKYRSAQLTANPIVIHFHRDTVTLNYSIAWG